MAKRKEANYESRFKKSANYDGEQHEPRKAMGSGSFANLPGKPLYAGFGKPEYRDGIINSFTCAVDELSDVGENHRE